MAYSSNIQWTQATWNPWHGCVKVSQGCKFCYMYRAKERYGDDPTIVQRSKTRFNDPLKWKEPRTIFPCSWSDFFIDQADEWRPEAWNIIKQTPHTYQILTKRPERILDTLPPDWGNGYPNVWLGVSGESAIMLFQRLDIIENIPAAIKWVSAEPLLEAIHLKPVVDMLVKAGINWVVIGGESGNAYGKYRYRPCQPKWITELIRVCQERNIKVFVKQLGSYIAKAWHLKDGHGGNIEEWPEQFRVREYP